jgi:cysteine synthase A
MTLQTPAVGKVGSQPLAPDACVRKASGTVLDAIGNTPLIEVDGVLAKLEYLNPSGSIKARIALYMIRRAEVEKRLRPGDTIVEATSGNTGNAMSMVASVLGYRMVVVMPAGLSPERTAISRAFGAEIVTVGDFHVEEALAYARELGCQPGCFAPQQFDSEWNVDENREWLGRELLSQMSDRATPDVLVAGVGTGGTLIGLGQTLRQAYPRLRTVAVEPDESRTLLCGDVGRHLIEGIADGFVPGIVERYRSAIDDVVPVASDDAVTEMHRLAREHGLFVGPSSGANMVAARRYAAADPTHTVLTLFCDAGEKYISQHFASA